MGWNSPKLDSIDTVVLVSNSSATWKSLDVKLSVKNLYSDRVFYATFANAGI